MKNRTFNIGGKKVTLTQEEIVRHSPKLLGKQVAKDYEPDDLYLVQLASLKQQGALGDEEPKTVSPTHLSSSGRMRR